jgi:hypothetical protein
MSEARNVFEGMEQNYGKHGPTVVSSLIFLFLLACALLGTAVWLPKSFEGVIVNLLVMIIGALAGWVCAIVVTPYSVSEASKFGSVAKAVSAFLSGYVLSKLDRFLEKVLFGAGGIPTAESWQMLGLFVGAFLIGFLAIFTSRAYFRKARIGVKSADTAPAPASR